MSEYWKKWLKAAAVRAVKTVAQTAVGVIGSAAVLGAVDWRMVASAALLAGIISMLTSVAGLPEVKEWAVIMQHICKLTPPHTRWYNLLIS